ncbi:MULTISPECIES: peptidoglycan DD-metalloendopeptidase family protein [unclassified Acinetobacter]|uniref:peptidoglycan DD-metalloendopeptidase family protein n=1 Tax=unclassified Acinetobacter TaxID=196816 RepID=UPI002934589C|nr:MULTISPECIES: peptidoglycan DD-metalloendopeptidase family protein [unclassified Acinetobacter]WOE32654.1 peptidoglycan DD-metalloendopeptidase family protein [Acinetobacter sp. SAAs470]WOE38130.1 peptidoglycan DD-metalloendopeptidase family protein [Acinetobacter sp. SAAs474]
MHLMFNVCCVRPFNLIRTTLISSAVVSTLVITGCASKPQVTSQTRSVTAPNYYTVRSGDTLSLIAARYGLNYLRIAEMNDITPPYRIYVGQSLRLTNTTQSKTTKTQPIQQATQIERQKINLPTQATTAASSTGIKPNNSTTIVNSGSSLKWVKPSNGPIIARFDLANNVKGTRFGGKVGDPVVAAADGQVVYAADGLKEYGNLILIKHANGYITAYAHNNKLLVKSGQNVVAGQKIAEMGASGTTQPMLEFQVRLDGKPINPEKIY